MDRISVDNFVWAKLTGHPPWPSVIVEPQYDTPQKPLDPEKKYFWVYFFGSHNYSWIEDRHIKQYEQYKARYIPLYKNRLFVEAVTELEEHLQNIQNDPEYKFTIQEKYKGKQISHKKRPKSKIIDVNRDTMRKFNYSETIVTGIPPSDKIFGVIGIGIIGTGLVRNLINSGHTVNIWNRTPRNCDQLLTELGFSGRLKSHISSRATLIHSDIVFICVADHLVAKSVIENNFGINSCSDHVLKDKGVVVMTSIDPMTSKDLRTMVEKKGGNFLEAQIQGSRSESVDERFCILTAGNEDLYHSCQSCFYAMGGITTFFLGEVGNAAKINMILQLMKGICLVALTEGLTLAERCGVAQDKFMNIFNLTGLSSPYLKGKGNVIIRKKFRSNTEQSLKNMQKDLKLGLELSNDIEHPVLLSSVANQIFKHCCKLDYGNHDAATIYLRNKH